MTDLEKSQAHSVNERLSSAVKSLATGKGDVRNRLEAAIMQLLPLRPEDFPEHLRSDFDWIIEQATKYEAQHDEGKLKATMKRIQNSTGEKIATRLYDMHQEIQRIIFS